MKIKSLITLVILGMVVLSFSVQSHAEEALLSHKNKNRQEEIPHITNEEEYAEFVKKREGAGQASAVKSTRSKNLPSSIRASVSRSASSSRAKKSSN